MVKSNRDEHSSPGLFRTANARVPRETGDSSEHGGRAIRRRIWPLRFERLFLVVGGVGLVVCVFAAAQMLFARRSAARFVSSSPANSVGEQSGASNAGGGVLAEKQDQTGSPAVVGRVEIPAIGMATPLLAGDDSMSLTQGAGHIPGTAYPGGLGTVGIAGHRDTHFRLLSKVAAGMDVRLVDYTGTYHYRVTSSEIVTPEQVSVLDIVSEPGLVLITCYPFHYVGSAPKRFVVHARLVSAAPDEAGRR